MQIIKLIDQLINSHNKELSDEDFTTFKLTLAFLLGRDEMRQSIQLNSCSLIVLRETTNKRQLCFESPVTCPISIIRGARCTLNVNFPSQKEEDSKEKENSWTNSKSC